MDGGLEHAEPKCEFGEYYGRTVRDVQKSFFIAVENSASSIPFVKVSTSICCIFILQLLFLNVMSNPDSILS